MTGGSAGPGRARGRAAPATERGASGPTPLPDTGPRQRVPIVTAVMRGPLGRDPGPGSHEMPHGGREPSTAPTGHADASDRVGLPGHGTGGIGNLAVVERRSTLSLSRGCPWSGFDAATAAAGVERQPGRVRQRTEVISIAFLRRLLGLNHPEVTVDPEEVVASPQPMPIAPSPIASVACPNCGVALDPPPDHTRRCPSCRRQIVVRHFEGRAIYLTEEAVEVFEAERQHEIDEQRWARERGTWLQLAQRAGAPADRRARLAAAALTAVSVAASRDLYLAAAERAARAARRDKRWDEMAQIRRRQAAALHEEAGAHLPPSDEIVALYREGVAATLRKLAQVSRDAELVGAACCQACRADNEHIFRIADELRTPRLPHAGCPRGLCTCDWWPTVTSAAKKPRRRRAPASPRTADDVAPVGDVGADADSGSLRS